MMLWAFVTIVLTLGSTQPTTTTHGPYPSEDACELARSAWLRAQAQVVIVELQPCRETGKRKA